MLMRRTFHSKFLSPKWLLLSCDGNAAPLVLGMGLLQTPSYLKVHFHQLVFLHEIVQPSCLQPGLCCLACLLKVNEDPQTLFGAVQRLSQSPVMVTGKKTLQKNHRMTATSCRAATTPSLPSQRLPPRTKSVTVVCPLVLAEGQFCATHARPAVSFSSPVPLEDKGQAAGRGVRLDMLLAEGGCGQGWGQCPGHVC